MCFCYFHFARKAPISILLSAEISQVSETWEKKLQETRTYSSYEIAISQVKRCVEIALRCVNFDRHKRPRIMDVVDELEGKKTSQSSAEVRSFWWYIYICSYYIQLLCQPVHLHGKTFFFKKRAVLVRPTLNYLLLQFQC